MATKQAGRRSRAENVAAKNPNADLEQVNSTIKLMDVLQDLGMTGARYRLGSPHGRRMFHSNDDEVTVPKLT